MPTSASTKAKPESGTAAATDQQTLTRWALTLGVGDRALPPEQQGLTVLGAPVGTEQYVQQFLKKHIAQPPALTRAVA